NPLSVASLIAARAVPPAPVTIQLPTSLLPTNPAPLPHPPTAHDQQQQQLQQQPPLHPQQPQAEQAAAHTAQSGSEQRAVHPSMFINIQLPPPGSPQRHLPPQPQPSLAQAQSLVLSLPPFVILPTQSRPGPTAIYQPTPQASQPSQPPHQAQGDAQPHLGEGQWDMPHANGDASGRQELDAADDEAHDLPHPMLLDDLMPDGPGQAGVARPRLSPLELQHQMEEKLRKLEEVQALELEMAGILHARELALQQQEAARMAAALDESMAAQEKEALRLQQAMEQQDRRALATVNSLRDEIRAEGLDILRQQQLDFNQALKETTSQGWAQLTTVAAAFAEQLKSNHVAHAAIQTIPTDLLQEVDSHPLSPPRPAAHEPGHTMQQLALRLPLPIPAGAINQDGAYLTRDGRAGQPFMDSPRSEGSSSAYSQDFSVRGTVAGTELTASIPAQGQGWRTVPGLSSPGVMDEQGPSYLSQASRQLHTTTIISEEFQ
ncbi:hypothetical protein QJQ45_015487, partial [Haematococcus lacustris]